MGLTQALQTSLSGLNATQTSIGIVAGNVANANTAGYIAQAATQVAVTSGNAGDSVRISQINRVLDQFVQTQLRSESSGGAYADLKANFYTQLQQIYGTPGSSTTLDSTFNNFTTAVQALSTSPNSAAAQSQTVSAAQALAQQLNSATTSIQTLRSQADQGIASDVQTINNALTQISNINGQLVGGSKDDTTAATLENQRDQYIDQVAKLMDVRVVQNTDNTVSLFTGSGAQLVGTQASQLQFTPTGTITPTTQYNADPTKSGLSTISLVSPSGGTTDLVANGEIRSGELAGYLNMRDSVLVQAQTQIDAIAAGMSTALSDTTTAGSGVTSGTQNGFSADIANLSAGNTVNISYTDASNVQHTVTVMRVDDPTALPLSNSVTSDPNDTVVGVSFAGGYGSVATQLNAALGATGLQFANTSGSTLRVLDSGPGTITVNSMSTTTTATSLTGSTALPLFVDGNKTYTGAVTGTGSESVGYAGRITVNAALVADPSKLVAYQLSTAAGDATRPNYIYDQLVNASLQYSPSTGIGGTASPFSGTLSDYMSQMVSTQSLAANAATNLKAGQDIVVSALQARFNSTSAVNIDTEMSNLLSLQNSYGANARVMSTVKAMLDSLMQM